MRWLRFAAFICLVTVLQAGLVNIIAISRLGIKPDLLLILMVFFSLYCNQQEAIITSFTIGFAADIIGSAMGPQIISFGLFGTLLSYLHGVVIIKKMPYQSLVIFISSILTGVIAYFLTLLKGQPATANAFTVIFGTSVYSSIVGPFLFLPAAWLMRIKTHRTGQH
ncbi:MAG: rod shape-determining protein MreD [Phycisphaerae bacterium]|nr:rod shape-determining protein MreD [Phycisphaerae bacterium]MDD5381565.1 rod shape-determining protein MreD [Phycisphaerae bacterium]